VRTTCYASLPRVGFELATDWSQVQCFTRWTTAPPKATIIVCISDSQLVTLCIASNKNWWCCDGKIHHMPCFLQSACIVRKSAVMSLEIPAIEPWKSEVIVRQLLLPDYRVLLYIGSELYVVVAVMAELSVPFVCRFVERATRHVTVLMTYIAAKQWNSSYCGQYGVCEMSIVLLSSCYMLDVFIYPVHSPSARLMNVFPAQFFIH